MKQDAKINDVFYLEENFSEWSEMGYSLSNYLFQLLKLEREKNEYLERRLSWNKDRVSG